MSLSHKRKICIMRRIMKRAVFDSYHTDAAKHTKPIVLKP